MPKAQSTNGGTLPEAAFAKLKRLLSVTPQSTLRFLSRPVRYRWFVMMRGTAMAAVCACSSSTHPLFVAAAPPASVSGGACTDFLRNQKKKAAKAVNTAAPDASMVLREGQSLQVPSTLFP